jgi:hypothetical protein
MAGKILIDIDVPKITRKVKRAWEKGLPQLSEEILNDCNQYCKEKTGALIASSLRASKPENAELIWEQCNAYIRENNVTPQSLIENSNVAAIFTTNEVFDDLTVFDDEDLIGREDR